MELLTEVSPDTNMTYASEVHSVVSHVFKGSYLSFIIRKHTG